jgi:hypothetical protein
MNKRRRFKAKRRRYEASLWQRYFPAAIYHIPQPMIGLLTSESTAPKFTEEQQEEAPKFTDAQQEDWRRQWRESTYGNRVVVLEDGMTFRAASWKGR